MTVSYLGIPRLTSLAVLSLDPIICIWRKHQRTWGWVQLTTSSRRGKRKCSEYFLSSQRSPRQPEGRRRNCTPAVISRTWTKIVSGKDDEHLGRYSDLFVIIDYTSLQVVAAEQWDGSPQRTKHWLKIKNKNKNAGQIVSKRNKLQIYRYQQHQ